MKTSRKMKKKGAPTIEPSINSLKNVYNGFNFQSKVTTNTIQ